MIPSRHQARQTALQILFGIEANVMATQQGQIWPEPHQVDLHSHFSHFETPYALQDFVSSLVRGTLLHRIELDHAIRTLLKDWKLERLGSVERNLLRLALYELKAASQDTPKNVILDEAIELAKEFCSADTASLINAVLDRYLKDPPTL